MQRRKTASTVRTGARWWWQFCQDVRVLVRLFPWKVSAALSIGVALAALLFEETYNHTLLPGDVPITYVKAIYAILNMVAFQITFADMPDSPALDIYFIIVPLIGIPLLLAFGINILNILRVFFVRGERGQAWQEALAATVEHPIIVCGLGRVGYRVAAQLLDLGQPVVGIDTTMSPLVTILIERGMPCILGDVHDKEVLRRAGVPRAQAVLACTNQDLVNIETVFHVRELNPQARIVLRLFEDSIADEVQETFNVKAVISRSAVAAAAFAHAAIGMEVLETFDLRDKTYFLTKLTLEATAPLVGMALGTMADTYDATVVCLEREGEMITEPENNLVLRAGDTLFVFTEMEHAGELARKRQNVSAGGPIFVCGLQHTGYRVVNALLNLRQPVVALDFAPDVLAEQLRGRGVPVIYGDFRQHAVLEQAGVRTAAAFVACAENDMVNFEAMLRARELVPTLRVVMRIFEESLGEQLQRAFHIDAVYSTSAIAAPLFVAEALNVYVVQPVAVSNARFGASLNLAHLTVATNSRLHRATIADLTHEADMTVLLHIREDEVHIPPDPACILEADDEIVVLTSQEKLLGLED
ncbi:MAG TPA: NAD-binding protein [Anaerolineae bacterium]|nr:NAD-binding protein [Anaerolineae bacterium]HQK13927.1 NAD-binding protein [Anaerolineae bacterium]